MLVRIVQFLLGALLAGGGGYLAWTYRAGAANLFPPGSAGIPWLVVAGVMAISAGLVFIVSALHPRPQRRARLAVEAAEREEALGAADAFYAERARAADRDWRSGAIPTPATADPMRNPDPVFASSPPPPPPLPPTPPTATKPVATSAPPLTSAATPFPATATLAPISQAAEPPPPAHAPSPEPTAAAAAEPEPVLAATSNAASVSFGDIREAIAQGRLEEAEALLNARRESAEGIALAELTGLAGDHAAAAGRVSNAKWLWRLALKRFGELHAMDAAPARAVAESLRAIG